MIDKLLSKFGYVRLQNVIFKDPVDLRTPDSYSEDELSFALARKLGVLDPIDKEYEQKIFEDLKGTDGLVQYLREAAARDKDRYFGAASKEEQLVIRGSFARTMYLVSRIVKTDIAK